MSDHCEGVCASGNLVCALVHGSTHEVFLGDQHKIWSKQHNGEASKAFSFKVDGVNPMPSQTSLTR